MEAPHVRPAEPADCAAIQGCVRAAYAKYRSRMENEPAPLHAEYATLIAQGKVYVLATEDVVCGVLVMMPQADALFVENVAVDPAFQGRGLGWKLMAFAEDEARAAQFTSIHLYTNEVMTENLDFYRRLGFIEEARRVEDGYARVFLRKQLPLG